MVFTSLIRYLLQHHRYWKAEVIRGTTTIWPTCCVLTSPWVEGYCSETHLFLESCSFCNITATLWSMDTEMGVYHDQESPFSYSIWTTLAHRVLNILVLTLTKYFYSEIVWLFVGIVLLLTGLNNYLLSNLLTCVYLGWKYWTFSSYELRST